MQVVLRNSFCVAVALIISNAGIFVQFLCVVTVSVGLDDVSLFVYLNHSVLSVGSE